MLVSEEPSGTFIRLFIESEWISTDSKAGVRSLSYQLSSRKDRNTLD